MAPAHVLKQHTSDGFDHPQITPEVICFIRLSVGADERLPVIAELEGDAEVVAA